MIHNLMSITRRILWEVPKQTTCVSDGLATRTTLPSLLIPVFYLSEHRDGRLPRCSCPIIRRFSYTASVSGKLFLNGCCLAGVYLRTSPITLAM